MKLYRYLMIFAAAVFMAACEKSDSTDEKGNTTPSADSKLVLSTDKIYIQSNGTDAAKLTLLIGGQPVTEDVTFYDGVTNAVVEINDMKFTATADGTYTIWASYLTFASNTIEIKAIPMAVPANPVDEGTGTDFERRVLVTQFTGTGCPNCPYMMSAVRKVYEDEAYKAKTVHVASHTSWSSVFYLNKDVHGFMAVSGAPWLVVDFDKNTKIGAYADVERTATDIRYVIDECYDAYPAMAGIAVNSVIEGNVLAVKALVKAAETAEYRIGAWLMEDSLEAEQAGGTADWMSTHNNVLRIADSEISASNFAGYKLGTVKEGEYSEYVFVMDLDPYWNKDNLHVAVFITNGGLVNNVVDCPAGSMVNFDYAE